MRCHLWIYSVLIHWVTCLENLLQMHLVKAMQVKKNLNLKYRQKGREGDQRGPLVLYLEGRVQVADQRPIWINWLRIVQRDGTTGYLWSNWIKSKTLGMMKWQMQQKMLTLCPRCFSLLILCVGILRNPVISWASAPMSSVLAPTNWRPLHSKLLVQFRFTIFLVFFIRTIRIRSTWVTWVTWDARFVQVKSSFVYTLYTYTVVGGYWVQSILQASSNSYPVWFCGCIRLFMRLLTWILCIVPWLPSRLLELWIDFWTQEIAFTKSWILNSCNIKISDIESSFQPPFLG